MSKQSTACCACLAASTCTAYVVWSGIEHEELDTVPKKMAMILIFRSFVQIIFSTHNIEGFWPEWCFSTIYHAWDTPFWSWTLICMDVQLVDISVEVHCDPLLMFCSLKYTMKKGHLNNLFLLLTFSFSVFSLIFLKYILSLYSNLKSYDLFSNQGFPTRMVHLEHDI